MLLSFRCRLLCYFQALLGVVPAVARLQSDLEHMPRFKDHNNCRALISSSTRNSKYFLSSVGQCCSMFNQQTDTICTELILIC